MSDKDFDLFRSKLLEISHINATLALLDWDMSVNLPEGAQQARGRLSSYLVGLAHNKFLAQDFTNLLTKLKRAADAGRLDEHQTAIIREVYRDHSLEKRLPTEFVQELTEATIDAHQSWMNARKQSQFKLFAPKLERIVKLKRQQCKYLGYKQSPYDALLDAFEPGLTSESTSVLFAELRNFLVPLLAQIRNSKVKISPKILKGKFEQSKQLEFNKKVIEKIGFDFNRGRLDISAHPFATSFHPTDVRITTRYKTDDLMYSVASSIHESGHGMYEQGLDTAYYGTPLGSPLSLGVHESQSRLWENLVGRGLPFWTYFYPLLRKEFPQPFSKIKLDEFYKAINYVTPSLIRTEADEVTYNLHIIIRFEIEKELIEGGIEVRDLPKIWNDKYKTYLGIKVPNDALGVLQDVHWSAGLIGYFPSYTLGNLYSAQLYAKAKGEIKDLESSFAKGDFRKLKMWLNKKIHQFGRFFSAEDLVRKVTGEPLNTQHYFNYISNKYKAIYDIR